MTKEEAIKYLQQLYPNGGHCWLDEQRIEAIGMAVKALKEEPVAPKVLEDMLNAKTAAESLGISPEEHDKIVDECLYGKEPELVDFDDMPLDPNIQYASREIGIKAHAEDYSFNIESELFQQLNKEQQELWRKEIEQACISGGYCGLNLGLDKRYDKEEPVSEDLEKEIEQYEESFRHKSTQMGYKETARHFAQWQKEQMMAKAVEGDITFDYYGDDDKTYGCIAHNSFCLEDFGLKDRDKVKVIVINED